MALSKVRKVDVENRVFRAEWTEKYLFVLPAVSSTRPVRLICSESVAVVKSINLKCHYETKHRHFEDSYPQQSEVRTRRINKLKAQYERSTRVLSLSLSAQQQTYECSLRIQWILGHKKPFTDGSIVKECMNAVSETLLDGKERRELTENIQQIPLSATTATRRTEILGEDVQSQLTAAIKSAPCRASAIDESTDISDNAQLLVYVRFYHAERNDFCEDILGITALTTHTRGEDKYLAIIL